MNLERVYNCHDRGPVSSWTDEEGRRWIESCARCYAFVHIVIMKKTGERLKACPRCLVILGEREMNSEWALGNKKPTVRNRISKYMGGL